MILIVIVLFVALLWALREIIVGFWVWKTRRSYRQLYRIEVTQRLFGEQQKQAAFATLEMALNEEERSALLQGIQEVAEGNTESLSAIRFCCRLFFY